MLAFRRGLLPPDYPQGLQSRIREELVLYMLSKEEDAENLKRGLNLSETILASHLATKQLSSHITSVMRRWARMCKLGLYSREPYKSAEDQMYEDGKQMAKVWQMMEESGKLDEIREHIRQIEERAERNAQNYGS